MIKGLLISEIPNGEIKNLLSLLGAPVWDAYNLEDFDKRGKFIYCGLDSTNYNYTDSDIQSASYHIDKLHFTFSKIVEVHTLQGLNGIQNLILQKYITP